MVRAGGDYEADRAITSRATVKMRTLIAMPEVMASLRKTVVFIATATPSRC